jgi:hypothetical protein
MQDYPHTRAQAGLLARVLIIALLSLSGACRYARIELVNAQPSETALAQAVLDALAAGDSARLAALAVTEAEFRKHIWPELPASRPEVGMPVNYVWRDASLKSRSDLAVTMEQRRGRSSTVTAVTFDRPATDYGRFRIHPGTRLTLRNGTGEGETARLFGSMIEADGQWKVYSYIVD